jgi:signal transduction histidine kinase
LNKSGGKIDVSLTITPIRDRYGTIIGASKVARNITQQKQMEAALHMSERLASVGSLAATIAHEINNPLSRRSQTLSIWPGIMVVFRRRSSAIWISPTKSCAASRIWRSRRSASTGKGHKRHH